ncbi:MAG: hypothetical protein K0B11_06030 [Mariniphaga sp.]|nr:hypothetical protein [Mariniphaga sp.]
MKSLIVLLFICISSTICAQKITVEKIQISHTYKDLYISYIAPLNCNDNQEFGPIIIVDSLIISEICELLNNSIQCNNYQIPDVRFKVEFFSNNEIYTLCFGQSGEGMIYLNKIYKYNKMLCKYLIKIIEESGAEKPKKIIPPKIGND